MEEKTKFKIGDEAYVIKNHKIQKLEIKAIVLTANGIRYAESEYGFISAAVPEEVCFESKEALITFISED